MNAKDVKRLRQQFITFGNELGGALINVAIALFLGAIIILAIGENPIQAYKALLQGSMGSPQIFANTLSKSIPLAFTGLAVSLANRTGMLNIGAEGQLYAGAMASALTALALPGLPRPLMLVVCVISGTVAGMAVGAIPGYFRAKRQTSEVIVAIMLNYTVMLFASYLANGPFKAEGSVSQTNLMPDHAMFGRLLKNSQLTSALFLLIGVAIILYIFLWRTPLGYRLRAVGSSPTAAIAAGISASGMQILAMALSGGVAALAGVTEVMGKYGRFIDGFSPSFGFTGIAVAILGRNHPASVLLTALLFGILDNGALRMGRVTDVSANMIVVIQSLIILLVSAPQIAKMLRLRRNAQ